MKTHDIAVVGGGPAGLAAAKALSNKGFSVALLSDATYPKKEDYRSLALWYPTISFLENIGFFHDLKPLSYRIDSFEFIGLEGQRLTFNSYEQKLAYFGYNIKITDLINVSYEKIKNDENVTLIKDRVASISSKEDFTQLDTINSGAYKAKLVILADGKFTKLAQDLDFPIKVLKRKHQTAAVTAVFSCEKATDHASHELHKNYGPFAMVPTKDHEFALVWVTEGNIAKYLAKIDDDSFCAQVEEASLHMLGKLKLVSKRNLFPIKYFMATKLYSDLGVVITGETAHGFSPIGAQGFNLTVRDIADLIQIIDDHKYDLRSPEILKTYEKKRLPDIVNTLRYVSTLDSISATDNLWKKLSYKFLLNATARSSALKDIIVENTLAGTFALPKYMNPYSTI